MGTTTTSTWPGGEYLVQIGEIYNQFLGYFPERLHGTVSFVLALILVYAIYKVIKRNFIYIIVLVLLLPPAGPILKSVWESLLSAVQFLLRR